MKHPSRLKTPTFNFPPKTHSDLFKSNVFIGLHSELQDYSDELYNFFWCEVHLLDLGCGQKIWKALKRDCTGSRVSCFVM